MGITDSFKEQSMFPGWRRPGYAGCNIKHPWRDMKPKRKAIITIASVIAAAVLAAVLAAGRGGDQEEIQTTAVVVGSIENRASGSGALEGVSCVDISAARQGTVDSISIEEGDTVYAGQLLLTLDDLEASAELGQARASSRVASIALSQSERELERTEALFAAGIGSEEELLQAQEAYASAEAELSRTRASEVIALDGMEDTEYVSPIGGVITALNIEEGETAMVGTMNNAGTVLLTVEDMSRFLVRVTMVESEVVNVRECLEAEITLDALPDTVFPGHVTRVALTSSNDAGGEEVAEYDVTVEMDASDSRMRSGMSASVDIITERVESCLVLPIQCIVTRQDPSDPSIMIDCVLRIVDGSVETVPVGTGLSDILDVQVTGLSEGDIVVSGPADALKSLATGMEAGTAVGDGEDSAEAPGLFGPGMGEPPPGAQGGPPPGGPGGR